MASTVSSSILFFELVQVWIPILFALDYFPLAEIQVQVRRHWKIIMLHFPSYESYVCHIILLLLLLLCCCLL